MGTDPDDAEPAGVVSPLERAYKSRRVRSPSKGETGPAQSSDAGCPSGGSLSPRPGNGAPLRSISLTRPQARELRDQLADALEDPKLEDLDVGRDRILSLLVELDTQLRGWIDP